MASMVYQLYRQLKSSGRARLFKGTGGYADGEQRRDFVFVGDVVRVNLALAEGPVRHGVFNVGTGQARSFQRRRQYSSLRGLAQVRLTMYRFPRTWRTNIRASRRLTFRG